ncbi:helix-turn-helix transcriptional regulator [Aestuariibius insulae]|uniref:helix-turn-helix transcriptional regulator n=1 Tax=Aestuariibius insulae TaxID=2058287 RepID=UPI00345E0ADB
MLDGKPAKIDHCRAPERRGLSRREAAEYVGVGTSKFDLMIGDGRMPQPKRIDGRRVWDRRQIDRAFELLEGGSAPEDNPWDL